VLLELLERHVGLVDGVEPLDVLEGGAELGIVDPLRLDTHAHADVGHVHVSEQRLERDVGAVQQSDGTRTTVKLTTVPLSVTSTSSSVGRPQRGQAPRGGT
jgi:hypothetical protein